MMYVQIENTHGLLICDQAFLVGNQWFSLEVMQFFISLINGIQKDTHIAYLVELMDLGLGGKLEELILGWKKNNVTSAWERYVGWKILG